MDQPPSSEPFEKPLKPLPKPTALRDEEKPSKPEQVEPTASQPERVMRTQLIEDLPSPTTEMALPPEPVVENPAPRWMFWKRRPRRDEQMDTIRQGAAEMVGLMRSIRTHLEAERAHREGLSKTLSPLPVAVRSLENISETHSLTGSMLTELKSSMERSVEKDNYLIKSLNRIGDTMGSVDDTFTQMGHTLGNLDKSNKSSLVAMEQLGKRVQDSDRFVSETFARLRDAEHEFIDYVARSSRRSTLGMAAVCSMLLLAIMAVGFMFKENRSLIAAMQPNGPLVVQSQPMQAPSPGMALLEELDQRDDGIGDPEREIALEEPAGSGAVEEPDDEGVASESLFRVSLEKESLLSTTEVQEQK